MSNPLEQSIPTAQRIEADDLFILALDGDFIAGSERPKERNHTLAKLACRTNSQGTKEEYPWGVQSTYTPSWSPETEVRRLIEHNTIRDDEWVMLNGLAIENHQTGASVGIRESASQERHTFKIDLVLRQMGGTALETVTYEKIEELDSGLVVVRLALAQAAARVFDYNPAQV